MIGSGILIINHKILVPAALKHKFLKKIYSGHQGINFCLKRAKELLFWVGYMKDIKELWILRNFILLRN